MEIQADLVAPCSAGELFSWVDDLERYPRWLEIVPSVAVLDDGAWAVDLRGKLGPLARTKRLRMVRTELDPPRRAVFERAELDGRNHSPWRLAAEVEATAEGARLAMSLHYGGGLFQPVVERLLREEIERSRQRLLALVTTPSA
ncbi:MAG: SRPBCC family protein [Acidimicrobiales bacterium]|nr:SRPBCC family protein [Acidimicrobiales bacterium]